MKRILILASAATALFYSSCKNETHEKEAEAKFLVTSPIQKDTFVLQEFVCQVHAISHIELKSQERGYLQNIYVDEGQFVKKGQLMFQIMPLMYQAETSKAQAEVDFVEIEYQNTKSLADSNIVSPKELALAKAHLNKTKAELSMAQAHLGFTEIRAPFDGMMGLFNVRLGSLVDEGELLTTLSDNSKMWVYFNVPEAEYLTYITAKAKSDNLLKVNLKMANNELFENSGIVETIEADFNNETGNIAFRATFPNPKGILRHGETGNILMPVFYKKALIIPQKATFDILDKKFVYVVDEKNVVQSRQITVAQEMPHLYIVTGLSINDKILAEGLGKVKNNEKIESEFIPFEEVLSDLNDLHAE